MTHISIQWVVAAGSVYTVPADVELFATFAIPQVEEADLCFCQIRYEVRALCSDGKVVYYTKLRVPGE